jgi:hypothetical protein
MTADHESTVPFEHVNRFPVAAVSRLSELEPGGVSIPTKALGDSLKYVDQYLATTGQSGTLGNGSVLAVIGEYGIGKTYIANEILRHLARHAEHGTTLVHQLSLDAPAASFLTLYRERFILRLAKQDVLDQVKEYYADIVADSFGDSDLTSGVAQLLRDRNADPRRIVERLGLMESRFLRELQRQLQHVTENESFGTALALFLRPQFEDSVWEWLTGHPPDPTLVERGVEHQIATDIDALEAMGVFAFLYGRKNHRFVVVIDELEKILSAVNRPDDGSVLAFRRLLEIFVAAGGLLVLCGLTDSLQVLPPDARSRIPWTVHPGPLTETEARDYIERTLNQGEGSVPPNPFDDDIVRHMVKLTGGTPRQLVRLCHRLYEGWLAAPERPISDAAMRVAIREQQAITLDEIRAEIRRALDTQGWLYEQGRSRDWLGVRADQLEYWVPLGETGAGCAIMLTDSVLQAAEVAPLAGQATAIRANGPQRRVLLIVGGHLAEDLREEVAAAFDTPPLTYDPSRFGADVTALLTGVLRNLREGVREDSLQLVRDEVDQMGRQLSRTQNYLELLISRIEVLRAGSDRQFYDLRRDLEETLRRAVQSRPEPSPDARGFGTPLPEPVQHHFDQAFEALNAVDGPDTLVQSAFRAVPPNPQSLGFRLRDREAQEAVGVAVLLRSLVETFRDMVAAWMYALPKRQPPSATDRVQLETLCSTFESTYAVLPLNRLEQLPEVTGSPGGSLAAVSWSSRRAGLREALEPLSQRVLNSALEATRQR